MTLESQDMTTDILADLRRICGTDIQDLLQLAVETGASDLHLTVPYPPSFRINGAIIPVEGTSPLTPLPRTSP